MNIGIFGATGTIGSRVVTEAVTRGHRVTAFTRDKTRFPADADQGQATWAEADWLDTDSIATAITELDVVISAVNAGYGIEDTIANADNFIRTAQAMVAALHRHPRVRLITVGGGGSLEVAPGVLLVDSEGFDTVLTDVLGVSLDYRLPVQAGVDALTIYRNSNRNWTYLSPSAGRIQPGERTGRFRIGGDQLLPESGGISAEDLAVALLDEAELPRHIQRRFTVGY